MASSESVETQRRLFTVEEANRTLPLVRAIVADIVEQFQVVNDLRQRLSSVAARRRSGSLSNDLYSEEFSRTQAELEVEETKFREFVEELDKLGVELKGVDGLCDFPSMVNGQPVYLCWRLGEPEVLYWHEIHAGAAGRQPIKPHGASRLPGTSRLS